jgi:pimeloyl-ACP methyl ester carboxylesterase
VADSHPILLVHGAWHGPWAWAKVERALTESGHDVRTLKLPSSGPDRDALMDMYEDAATVRRALDGIGEDTVVVGHSYGGVVITEGAAGATNVAHLVYLAAFMLDEGESLLATVGGEFPEWCDVSEDGRTVIPTRPEETFYNDCPPEEAAEAAAVIQPQLVASFGQPLRSVAWHDAPSTYVICEQDNAIPPVAQEQMSRRAGEVRRMDASHSPFLSRPGEVVELIAGLASAS